MVAQEGRAENHYIKTKCQCVAALRDFFVALEDFRRLRLNFKLLCFRKDLSQTQAFLFLHHLLRFVKTFAIVLLTFAFALHNQKTFVYRYKKEKSSRETQKFCSRTKHQVIGP